MMVGTGRFGNVDYVDSHKLMAGEKILDGCIYYYGMDGDEEFVNPRTRRSYGSKTNQLSESSVVESSNQQS